MLSTTKDTRDTKEPSGFAFVSIVSFVLLVSSLCAGSAAAQEPSTAAGPSPSTALEASAATYDLPVSLERIREGLTGPPTPSLLDALARQPHFRVEVQERRPTFTEMFSLEDFDGGPVPPGGLYAYEQARRLSPNSTPALASIDLLPVFRGIAGAIGNARRHRAEAAARAEVARAMAEFCAARLNNGEGVVGCSGASHAVPLR